MTIELTVYFLGEDVQLNTTVVVEEVSIVVYDGYFSSGGGGGAVDSVNGKTGVVVLNASDIAETSTLKWLTSTLKDAYDGAVSGKVDKLSGKGLSSNDFTNSDKNKLDSLSNYTGFRGAGASLSSIQTAYPTGSLGDWAIITNPSGNAYFAIWDPDVSAWIDAGQSPTIPGTNLSYSISGNTLTITSDTGTDVTIPLATGSVAGLMSFEDKLKIDSITEIFTASLKTIYDGYASQITAKASASEVATVLFKSITPTIITGKTLDTSIYSIPLPTDGSDYMIKVYSQAQISTFLGAPIAHRLRIGSYASPIDGASGANSIGQQTIVAGLGIGAATQFPLSRNFIFKGGVSGSIYGISTASNILDDANSVGVFSTLASKDFTTQYYLYVSFNPTNVGAVVQHNQILVTAIKI